MAESRALVERHRRNVHPEPVESADQQRGNKRAREESNQRVLSAFDGSTWMTVAKLVSNCDGLGNDGNVRKVLARLVDGGRVQRKEAGVSVFRRKPS